MADPNTLLSYLGYTQDGQIDTYHRLLLILSISGICTLLFFACKKIIIPAIRKIVAKTSAKWDDHLLNSKVLNAACQLLPVAAAYVFCPFAFKDLPLALEIIRKLLLVGITGIGVKLICAFISSFYVITNESDNLRKRPLKGFYQMLKVVVISVGTILIFSILFDKRPDVLLTGIGASAAILMLVFKDTIMSLVAGVQLNAYDMLRPGDWIVMEKHGANGVVTEVTLNIVKVKNWDSTTITIPTYLLVSESFQNWRGMRESGGRRIKETIFIDAGTVHRCSEEESTRLRKLVGQNQAESDSSPKSNLHYFRHFMEKRLKGSPGITEQPHLMVRLLPSTPQGLPIEIYCFTTHTDWVPYEHFKAEIMEYAYVSLPLFGLRAFQSPSGTDIATRFSSEN